MNDANFAQGLKTCLKQFDLYFFLNNLAFFENEPKVQYFLKNAYTTLFFDIKNKKICKYVPQICINK